METAIAIALVVIVGLLAVRTVYRMVKGKDDYSACGCGCPACAVESCPTRDAPSDDAGAAADSDAATAAGSRRKPTQQSQG